MGFKSHSLKNPDKEYDLRIFNLSTWALGAPRLSLYEIKWKQCHLDVTIPQLIQINGNFTNKWKACLRIGDFLCEKKKSKIDSFPISKTPSSFGNMTAMKADSFCHNFITRWSLCSIG